MKKLLLLRHAKSSWKHPQLADHERPLNARGRAAAPRMGELLYEENLVPDVILSSTARRARQTAEMVAEASGFAGEIRLVPDLYHGWPADYLDSLRTLLPEVQTALVVGHNPGLEELLDLLSDESEPLPTAALAFLVLPIASWAELTPETEATLRGLWRPRQLEG